MANLPKSVINTIKATAPVVGAKSTEITGCFYPKLFKNNPETLNYFNKSNQAQGFQQQALADAVVAYALNIDNLGALEGAVKQITHRHVALNITAPLYPIVHKNLMLAIAETLGQDVASEEVGGAWSQAVSALADVLIGAEDELARELAARPGGWKGEREFELAGKKELATDSVRFTFRPTDGYTGGFEFTPGQYLTIRIPELGAAPRHYTITSKSGDPFLECTTRKVSNGQVSTFMHDKMEVGTKVLLGVPAGLFNAQPNPEGCVLVSAGIGVTPMWAFFNHIRDDVKAVWCINPTEDRALFVDEFQKSGVPTTALSSGSGKCNLKEEAGNLVAKAGKECDFYICGPRGFMLGWREALVEHCGVKEGNVRMEVFGTGSPAATCPAKKA